MILSFGVLQDRPVGKRPPYFSVSLHASQEPF